MKKIKKIRTLKDLRDLLSTIPDDDLDVLGISPNFESDGVVAVCTYDEMYELFDKYPQLNILDHYLKNICKMHERVLDEKDDMEDIDDFITSE